MHIIASVQILQVLEMSKMYLEEYPIGTGDELKHSYTNLPQPNLLIYFILVASTYFTQKI